jgi:hypothetical protein
MKRVALSPISSLLNYVIDDTFQIFISFFTKLGVKFFNTQDFNRKKSCGKN